MKLLMREFNVNFAKVRRQAGTMVMRLMALVAKMTLPSNKAAPRDFNRRSLYHQASAGIIVCWFSVCSA